MTKLYSTKSNAKRALDSLLKKINENNPSGRVVIQEADVGQYKENGEDGFALILQMAVVETELDPAFVAELADYIVEWPEAPSPRDPLIQRTMKPYSEWEFSDVESPLAVAWDIFEKYRRKNKLDNRKEAIQEAMDAGVQRNTAHTQYRRFRIKHGLPGAVGKKADK